MSALPPFWRLVRAVCDGVFRGVLGWRLDVRGLGHVPRRGGAVITFNHHSYVDFAMLAWPIATALGRPVRFLAKGELWRRPSTRWLADAAGAVPVDRASAAGRHRAFESATDALAAGDLIAVAPEQTISRSFELLPFRTGAVRMAQAAGVPIVPSVGWGSQRFATSGQPIHLVRRIPVVVRFDTPIHVEAADDPVAVTHALHRRTGTLLDRVQRCYPDRPAPDEDDWWVPASLGGGAPAHADVLRAHRARTDRWGRP